MGEGYDVLVIDEAQEYTIDQESALKYVISASSNPQTIMLGTPPTAISHGTVFQKMRDKVLEGKARIQAGPNGPLSICMIRMIEISGMKLTRP